MLATDAQHGLWYTMRTAADGGSWPSDFGDVQAAVANSSAFPNQMLARYCFFAESPSQQGAPGALSVKDGGPRT